jgi:hypothetical protein
MFFNTTKIILEDYTNKITDTYINVDNTQININDVCLIITGLIHEGYIDELINMYKNINTKIISTWVDQDKNLLNKLKLMGFIILLNECPRDPRIIYQSIQTKYALLKATELGFRYSLRFRTDMYIKHFEINPINIQQTKDVYYLNNINSTIIIKNNYHDKLLQFIECTKHLYNKITFICGELCNNSLHPNDLIYFGPINELLMMFNEILFDYPTYPELLILTKYFKKKVLTPHEYKSKLNSCVIECIENNIDFVWNGSLHNIQNLYLINDHIINKQIKQNKFIIY